MKKYLFGLTCVVVLSCSKDKNQCNNCVSESKTATQIEIINDVYQTNFYPGDINFYSVASTDQNKVLQKLGVELEVIENIAIFLLSNRGENTKGVSTDNVVGLVVYQKVENRMNVKIFRKENNLFIENNLSDISSSIISTNDVLMIANIFFNGYPKEIISIISFKDVINRQKVSDLQIMLTQLDKEKQRKVDGPIYDRTCFLPCVASYDDAMCTAQEHQSGLERWFCFPISCGTTSAANQINNADSIFSYNFENIFQVLYSFRDDYLAFYEDEFSYINTYYSLSNELDAYEKFDLLFSVETFDFISIILPKLNSLLSNPNSQTSVIFDSYTKQVTLDFLNKVKGKLVTQESKDTVDFLIAKLEEFENQSNEFITNNL